MDTPAPPRGANVDEGGRPAPAAPDPPGTLRRWALATLATGVVLLPLEQQPVAELFGRALQAADLAFVAALALWLGGLLQQGRSPGWSRSRAWMAVYVVLLGLSILVSPAPVASLGKWLGVVYLALLAWMAASLATDRRALRTLVLAWLVGATVAALLSLVAVVAFYAVPGEPSLQSLYYRYGSLPPGPYPRVRSLFLNANAYATYLIASIGLLLVARDLGWVRKGLSAAGLAVMLAASLATVSPVLGALALCLGAWAFVRFRQERPRLAAGLLVAGVALMLGSLLAVAVNPVHPWLEPSVRLRIWADAVATIAEAPFTGVGLGQAVVERWTTVASGARQFHTDAHNVWLSVAGQAGLPAAVALAGMIWTLLAAARAAPVDPVRRTLGLALLGGFVLAGLTGSFEDERHLWLLMGLLMARTAVAAEPARAPD